MCKSVCPAPKDLTEFCASQAVCDECSHDLMSRRLVCQRTLIRAPVRTAFILLPTISALLAGMTFLPQVNTVGVRLVVEVSLLVLVAGFFALWEFIAGAASLEQRRLPFFMLAWAGTAVATLLLCGPIAASLALTGGLSGIYYLSPSAKLRASQLWHFTGQRRSYVGYWVVSLFLTFAAGVAMTFPAGAPNDLANLAHLAPMLLFVPLVVGALFPERLRTYMDSGPLVSKRVRARLMDSSVSVHAGDADGPAHTDDWAYCLMSFSVPIALMFGPWRLEYSLLGWLVLASGCLISLATTFDRVLPVAYPVFRTIARAASRCAVALIFLSVPAGRTLTSVKPPEQLAAVIVNAAASMVGFGITLALAGGLWGLYDRMGLWPTHVLRLRWLMCAGTFSIVGSSLLSNAFATELPVELNTELALVSLLGGAMIGSSYVIALVLSTWPCLRRARV